MVSGNDSDGDGGDSGDGDGGGDLYPPHDHHIHQVRAIGSHYEKLAQVSVL